LLHFAFCAADIDVDSRQDDDILFPASERYGPAFDIVIIFLRLLQSLRHGEHAFGGAAGKRPALRRTAGLEDDRRALWRARQLERPSNRIKLASMVDRSGRYQGAAIFAALGIPQSFIVPALPQLPDHIDKLFRAFVAVGLFGQLRQAEIGGGIFVIGSDHVPAGRPLET